VVFHRNGKRSRDFRGAWATACETAGLTGRNPNEFRRTAVREMVRGQHPGAGGDDDFWPPDQERL
jgi:hypothetical protein